VLEIADLANNVPGISVVHNLMPLRGRAPVIDRLLWPTVATLPLIEFAS
jgi:hypothetical protein